MYLIIPIGIFLLSVAGIVYILVKKFVYLRKLSPEAINDTSGTKNMFWSDMFPEISRWMASINWREHRVRLTDESEKFVRRLRLIFLKIETFTHNVSMRLRRSKKHHEAILVKEEQEMVEDAVLPIAPLLDPKEEEQHLIMEIAKNPKDPLLYLRLGDVYMKTGDKDNARLSFETVLQLDPENWYAKKKVKDLPKKPE